MWAFLWALTDPSTHQSCFSRPSLWSAPSSAALLSREVTNHQKLLDPFHMGNTRSYFLNFGVSFLVLGHVSTWHWGLGSVLCSLWVVSGLWASSSWNNGVKWTLPSCGSIPCPSLSLVSPWGVLCDHRWIGGGFCCSDNRFVWGFFTKTGFFKKIFQFRKTGTIRIETEDKLSCFPKRRHWQVAGWQVWAGGRQLVSPTPRIYTSSLSTTVCLIKQTQAQKLIQIIHLASSHYLFKPD